MWSSTKKSMMGSAQPKGPNVMDMSIINHPQPGLQRKPRCDSAQAVETPKCNLHYTHHTEFLNKGPGIVISDMLLWKLYWSPVLTAKTHSPIFKIINKAFHAG